MSSYEGSITKPSLKEWDSAGNFNPPMGKFLGVRHLAGLTDEHSVGDHADGYERGFTRYRVFNGSFEESLEI